MIFEFSNFQIFKLEKCYNQKEVNTENNKKAELEK